MDSSRDSRTTAASGGGAAATEDDDDDDDTERALTGLLAALAAFAKAAQTLSSTDEATLEYEASFPEFQQAWKAAQTSLAQMLQTTLAQVQQQTTSSSLEEALPELDTLSPDGAGLVDSWLLEQAADACDALVEQVEAYLQQTAASSSTSPLEPLQAWARQAHEQHATQLQRLVANTRHNLPRPQQVYEIAAPHSSRTEPFVPRVHTDKPHAVTPLDLTLQEGHGYDTRFGKLRSSNNRKSHPDETVLLVAPRQHCPHPYQREIETFTYTPQQLQATQPDEPIVVPQQTLTAEWIDTEPQLQQLAERLTNVTALALDLEAHSYHSYAGLTCLIQISVRLDPSAAITNYLIDTLALHHCLNRHLADVLANPRVAKILHGADSDVQWLQRDFGLYIVNLFDTGRAARQLQLPSASYAYLLQHYCQLRVDKSLQLADWRVRPLTPELRQYAIQDTYYLLQIYPHLKWDLLQQNALQTVLDTSRLVCLIRYTPEPWNPQGYRRYLSSSSRSNTQLSAPHQHAVAAALWEWRDATARRLDESVLAVLTESQWKRLVLACPTTVAQLQNMFQPVPTILQREVVAVTQLIQRVMVQQEQEEESKHKQLQSQEEPQDDDSDKEEDLDVIEITHSTGTTTPSFFPATEPPASQQRLRAGMMSPVLGTEALYRRAGWLTPSTNKNVVELAGLTTTEDEDDDDDEEDVGEPDSRAVDVKPKKLLTVHTSNRDYKSAVESGGGRTVDGMGSARSTTSSGNINQKKQEPTKSLQRPTSSGISTVLGLVARSQQQEGTPNETAVANQVEPTSSGDNKDSNNNIAEDFRIPRSIREIYMISNRNRRHKKAGSPTDGAVVLTDRERAELERAEAVLREHGDLVAGYFDDADAHDDDNEEDANNSNSPGKRPRAKSEESGGGPDPSSTDANNVPSKEEDVAFMKEIGWIKDTQDVEGLFHQQSTTGKPSSQSGRGGRKGGYNDKTTAADSVPAAVGITYNPGRPNPFFAGAALQGGPLAQQQGTSGSRSDHRRGGYNINSSNSSSNKGKTSNRGSGNNTNSGSRQQQERPEKKDARTHAYRKR